MVHDVAEPAEARREPLRFALAAAGDELPAWQAACLRELVGSEHARLVQVLAAEPDRTSGGPWSGLGAAGEMLLSRRVLWPAWHGARIAPRSRALRTADVSALVDGVPRRPLRPDPVGGRPMLDEDDLDALRAADVDVILWLLPQPPDARICGAAREGLWLFRHHGHDGDGAQPAAFWEMHGGEPVTRVYLERRTRDGAGVEVLRSGSFRTHHHSYVVNLDTSLLLGAAWPAEVARDIRRGDAPPSLALVREPARGDATRRPRDREILRFAARLATTFVRNQVDDVARVDQWNVGVVPRPIHAFLDPLFEPRIEWLPLESPRVFAADPFGIEHDGRLYIFFERFDYAVGSGDIAVVERLAPGRYSRPQVVMSPDEHLSYPYVFRHDGAIWCVPEGAESGAVRLFRACDFPTRWEPVADLLPDFPGIDPTLFRHGGRWWLFACDGRAEPVNALHIWWADDLLGPWHPHAGNPVKVDVRSSRPGGTPFVHRGRLYRPAQDGAGCYGGAVVVNEITRLTPGAFEEHAVRHLAPSTQEYPHGFHTLSAAGGLTLVDAKRRVLLPERAGRKIGGKLRRLVPGRAGR